MRKVLNSRLFKILYTIFVIIYTLIIGCYILFVCFEKKSIFDYSFYVVPDNSMKSSYQKNDVVAIKKIDKLILEVGNDIAYYGKSGGLEGKLIIHRIINIDNSNKKEPLFTTQSITSSLPDPVIHKKDIIGKVMGKVDILTILNHLVKNQLGFFLIVFLPLTLILIIEILKTTVALKLEKKSFNEPELLEVNDKEQNDKKKKNKK